MGRFLWRSLLKELQLPSETEIGEVIISSIGNGGLLHKHLLILLGSSALVVRAISGGDQCLGCFARSVPVKLVGRLIGA